MGKQKALNPEDLWDLPYSDEAAAVSQVCVFTSMSTSMSTVISCSAIKNTFKTSVNAAPGVKNFMLSQLKISSKVTYPAR